MTTISKEQTTFNSDQLKCTVGTYFYDTAKALSKCLAPVAENQQTVKNLEFGSIGKDEIVLTYDVTSFFMENPPDETINHFPDAISHHNKLPRLTSRLVIKRLLERATNGTYLVSKGTFINRMMAAAWATPFHPP